MVDKYEVWSLTNDGELDDYQEGFASVDDARTYCADGDEDDTNSYAIVERVIVGRSIVKKTRKWEKA